MRLLICWVGISGYLSACWRALAARPGITLKIITFESVYGSPKSFDRNLVAGLDCEILPEERIKDTAHIARLAADFRPDVVVICGWIAPAFSRLAFHPAMASAKFAMGVDTPRKDTWRQKLARFKIGRLLDRMDRVIVAGERAWQLMRMLRVPETKLARGVYGIDQTLVKPSYARRAAAAQGWPRRFLFIGRYHPHKAVDILAAAYRVYRANFADAWPLLCCGTGPMGGELTATEGIEDLGFVQPGDQPAVWEKAGVFVLASRFDPWPLVIVEAAAAGLPVICTESCGSSVELVRSYHNGLTVATENVDALAGAMAWMHTHHDRLAAMGARSTEMAAAYTAERWAERWAETLRPLCEGK